MALDASLKTGASVLTAQQAPGAAAAGITKITSSDGSVFVGSPTGPTVDLKVASGGPLAVASRAALALVDCTPLADGKTGTVKDIGDGAPATYILMTDARAADGVFRIAALNKAGHLWVCGDGVSLVRNYVSPKIDFKATSSNNVWFGGAAGASDLLFLPQAGKLVVTDFAATAGSPVTTAMTWNSGNDTSKTNVTASGAVPTGTAWNNMIVAGVAAPMFNTWNTNVSSLKALDASVKIDVTIAAAGTNLTTLKGKFIAFGILMAASTAT